MKVHVDFDCTPEEARRLMGLPDLTLVHDAYVGRLSEAVATGVTPEMIEGLMKSWSPMGEVGFKLWQTMFDQAGGKAK